MMYVVLISVHPRVHSTDGTHPGPASLVSCCQRFKSKKSGRKGEKSLYDISLIDNASRSQMRKLASQNQHVGRGALIGHYKLVRFCCNSKGLLGDHQIGVFQALLSSANEIRGRTQESCISS